MCGIAGFSLSDKEIRTNTKKLTKRLLLGIESRGQDATGFAFIDKTGTIQVHKTNVTASKFVRQSGRMSVPKGVQNVICHTRFATQGAPEANENNHPIQASNVVGVHNGCLSNDRALWAKMGIEKIADVDSAAIFGALSWGTSYIGEKPTFKSEVDVLENLSGSVALAWLDENAPTTLTVARVASSPLVVAITEGGSFIFASEAAPMVKAVESVGLTVVETIVLAEGDLLRVMSGEIREALEFSPMKSYHYYGTSLSRGAAIRSQSWSDEDDYTSRWGGNKKANDERAKRYELLSGNEQWENDRNTVKSAKESAEIFQGSNVEAVETRESIDRENLNYRFIQGTTLDVMETCTISDYHRTYNDREEKIDAWMLKLNCTNYDVWNSACTNLHAFIRPGDKVTADFLGETVNGEVVLCPQDFPGGKYVLRLFIHNTRRDGNIESVLVERKGFEFKETEPYIYETNDKVETTTGKRVKVT